MAATIQFGVPTMVDEYNRRNLVRPAAAAAAAAHRRLLSNRSNSIYQYYGHCSNGLCRVGRHGLWKGMTTNNSTVSSTRFGIRKIVAMANNSMETFELVMKLKSSPDKIWQSARRFPTVFPKVLPDMYEGIQVIEGDGRSAGTVYLATFKPEMKIAKEKIEFVDEEGMTMRYRVVGGDFLEGYKSFVATLLVGVGNNGIGSEVKYSAEFEKEKDRVPHVPEEFIQAMVLKVYHDLDAYLLKNP